MEQNQNVEATFFQDYTLPSQESIQNYQDEIEDNFFKTLNNLDMRNSEYTSFTDPYNRYEFSNEHRKQSLSEQSNIQSVASIDRFVVDKKQADENGINATSQYNIDQVKQKQSPHNLKRTNTDNNMINQSISNDQHNNALYNESESGQMEQNKQLFMLSSTYDTLQPKRRIPFPGQQSQKHNPYISNKNLFNMSQRTFMSQQVSTQQESARQTLEDTDGNDILEHQSFEKENMLQQDISNSQGVQSATQQHIQINQDINSKNFTLQRENTSEGSIKSYDSSCLQTTDQNNIQKKINVGLNMKSNTLANLNIKSKQKDKLFKEINEQAKSYDENTVFQNPSNLKNHFLQAQELNNSTNINDLSLQYILNESIQQPTEDEQEEAQVISVKLENIINTNRHSCKTTVYCEQKRYEVRFSENDNAYQVAKEFLDRYNLSSKYQTYVQTEVQKVINVENKRMQKYQYEVSKREKHQQYQFQPFNFSSSRPKQDDKKDEVLFKMMIQVAGRKQYLAFRQNDTAEELALQFLHMQQLSKEKYFYQVASQVQENISNYMRLRPKVVKSENAIQNFKIF